MGYIVAVSVNLDNKEIFYRKDGGSNRYETFKFLINYIPENTLSFTNWLEDVKNKEQDSFSYNFINR